VWEYFREKAEVLRIEGRPLESEETLRTIVHHSPDHPTPSKVITLERLVRLLTETNPITEVLFWIEKISLMDVEMYRLEHKYSQGACEQLGLCYASLGCYDAAIYLFQQGYCWLKK
jgi:hypothetical protein